MKARPITERIEALRNWRWSSYPSYIGKCNALDFVEYGPLLAEMSGKRREWPKRYREFVESGLAESDDDFLAALKRSPRSIVGVGFRAWVDDLYQKRIERHANPEDVSFRHVTEPMPADEVLMRLCRAFAVEKEEFLRRGRSSALRSVAAHFLIRYSGLTQRDAARVLNIGSGAAECNQLKSLPDKLEDRGLQTAFQKADAELKKYREDRCSST